MRERIGEDGSAMGVGGALVGLLTAIGEGDARAVGAFLDADPALVADRLDRADERFIPRCHAQLYAGDTALHAAAFAYDVATARRLVDAGSSVRARNRRGAEPLHAATMGVPGSTNWDPDRQRAVIEHLLAAGADVAAASDRGSTPWDLAQRATGRSGSGAPEARAEQLRIVELLAQHR